MKSQITRRMPVLLLCVLCVLCGCIGLSCSTAEAPAGSPTTQQAVGGIDPQQALADARAEVTSLKAQVNALPEGPVKAAAQKQLDKAESFLSQIESYVALGTGLLGIGAALWNWIKKNAAEGHLKNVVHSIEYAGPDWTPDHAAAVAAIQGPETTAAVNAIKNEIGIQPVATAAK